MVKNSITKPTVKIENRTVHIYKENMDVENEVKEGEIIRADNGYFMRFDNRIGRAFVPIEVEEQKIGDEFNERNEEVDSLSASLHGSRGKVATLERDIGALQRDIRTRDGELQQAKELAKPELLTLLQAGIEMDLLFRTDEHVLSDSTGVKLRQLAASLAANPDIQIRLDGFSDERGNEEYNRELSVKRAEHVRDVLVTAGIPAARIAVSAHGESPAVEQNADSFALERRVSLTLYLGETPSFASNPR